MLSSTELISLMSPVGSGLIRSGAFLVAEMLQCQLMKGPRIMALEERNVS